MNCKLGVYIRWWISKRGAKQKKNNNNWSNSIREKHKIIKPVKSKAGHTLIINFLFFYFVKRGEELKVKSDASILCRLRRQQFIAPFISCRYLAIMFVSQFYASYIKLTAAHPHSQEKNLIKYKRITFFFPSCCFVYRVSLFFLSLFLWKKKHRCKIISQYFIHKIVFEEIILVKLKVNERNLLRKILMKSAVQE